MKRPQSMHRFIKRHPDKLNRKRRVPHKNTEYEQFIGWQDAIHHKFIIEKHLIHKVPEIV